MYNLDFLRRFSLMGTTLCAAPNNIYVISTNVMYILKCPHVTYFALTYIHSCFGHVQQYAPPRIVGSGHPCSDRSLFKGTSSLVLLHPYLIKRVLDVTIIQEPSISPEDIITEDCIDSAIYMPALYEQGNQRWQTSPAAPPVCVPNFIVIG